MPCNRAETMYARRVHRGAVYDTPLGKKLVSSQYSAAHVARVAGVRRGAVCDFFHRRIRKAGKDNCRRIRAALIDLGVIKPHPRKPPVCRNCGIIYPTRKGASVEFHPATNVQASLSSVPTPFAGEETKP